MVVLWSWHKVVRCVTMSARFTYLLLSVPEDAQLVPLGHELDALRVRAARAHLDRILGRGHRRAEHEVALPLMRHLDAAQHLVLRRAVGDHNPPLDLGARRDHLVDLARLRDQEVCRLDRLLGEQLVQPLLVAIVECLLLCTQARVALSLHGGLSPRPACGIRLGG